MWPIRSAAIDLNRPSGSRCANLVTASPTNRLFAGRHEWPQPAASTFDIHLAFGDARDSHIRCLQQRCRSGRVRTGRTQRRSLSSQSNRVDV